MLNDAKKAVNGSSILLLGVTYKANISDERESPARPLARRLRELGANVSYFDPHAPSFEVEGEPLTRVDNLARALESTDLAILVQPHDAILAEGCLDRAPMILDTRGALEGPTVERI